MAKVEQSEVEEVDDQQQLSLPEMTSHPQHDEAKCEEIVLQDWSVGCSYRYLREHTKMKWLPTLAALVTKALSALQR